MISFQIWLSRVSARILQPRPPCISVQASGRLIQMQLGEMGFLKVPMVVLPGLSLPVLQEQTLIIAARYFVMLLVMYMYQQGRGCIALQMEGQAGQPLHQAG